MDRTTVPSRESDRGLFLFRIIGLDQFNGRPNELAKTKKSLKSTVPLASISYVASGVQRALANPRKSVKSTAPLPSKSARASARMMMPVPITVNQEIQSATGLICRVCASKKSQCQ